MKNKIVDKQLANAKVLADTIKDVFTTVTSAEYCMSCNQYVLYYIVSGQKVAIQDTNWYWN